MENIVKSAVIFAAGVSIGAAVTWKLLKEKYARIAQEEIDSVKEVYSAKESKIKKILSEADVIKIKDNPVDESIRHEYSKTVASFGYTNAEDKKEVKEEIKLAEKPYVIPPEDFDDLDYDTVTLTYYADKVLADEYDNQIEDVESLVGEESLTHFGEYEEDSVYVRNDQYKTDYEILLDMRTYEEATDVKAVYPGDDE